MTDTTTDNPVTGYNFFDPETGIGRFIKVNYAPLRTAWPADNPPTKNDVLGIDMSLKSSPTIKFDVTRDETLHRAAIIQRAWAVGVDIASVVQDLPDNYISEFLNNVVYNRPLVTLKDCPIRLNDNWVVNPYTLAPAYLINYLLMSMAAALVASPVLAVRERGANLQTLANQLQFLIDRILIQFDITNPTNAVILEGRSISITVAGKLTSKSTTLFVSQENFDAWAAKGGTETLLVADWGLNGHNPDDSTLNNKATILANWAKAQTPPSS